MSFFFSGKKEDYDEIDFAANEIEHGNHNLGHSRLRIKGIIENP